MATINVFVFQKGELITPKVRKYLQPTEALADLVERLTEDTGVNSIGPLGLSLNCPILNERVEYEGEERDLRLLLRVGHLYIPARAWHCLENVRQLDGR